MTTRFLIWILAVITFVAAETCACNLDPTASLSADPDPVCLGQTATFDASASSDPDGGDSSLADDNYIKKWQWDWTNDGDYDTTETAPGDDGVATHTYGEPGTYTVKLKVTDNDDAEGGTSDHWATTTCAVTVVELGSVDSDDVACTGQDVEFTATTSPAGGEDCVSWSGGGTPATGTGATFTTSWSSVGTKTITATCGTCSKTKDVDVIDGLTVLPRKAYVCMNDTKDFKAWTCVDEEAQNVTASSTFSSSNGSMTGNTLFTASPASTSEGSDFVQATYDGDTTDSSHDCDLTVIGVEIECFDRVPPGQTKDVDVTVSPSLTGTEITLEVVRTAGTSGSATVSPSSITGDTTVAITGGEQTNVGNPYNLDLRANLDGCECESMSFSVCAHPDNFYADHTGPVPGTHYGVAVYYQWVSDSDNTLDLDQCKLTESFDNCVSDNPPFDVSDCPSMLGEPMMGNGEAGDARVVLKDVVYDYQDGHNEYDQEQKYECLRCGAKDSLSSNHIDHWVHWLIPPPPYVPCWRIMTTVTHGCPGLDVSVDENITE